MANFSQLKEGPNPDRGMAHSLQHRQAAQFVRLSSTRARKHRSDRPKANNALTFEPEEVDLWYATGGSKKEGSGVCLNSLKGIRNRQS